MDINKTLIEFGKLKVELKDLNKQIKRLFKYQSENEENQLSEYFDYWKNFKKYFDGNCLVEPEEIEEWSNDWGEEFSSKPDLKEVTESSYKLLKLIEHRKIVRI